MIIMMMTMMMFIGEVLFLSFYDGHGDGDSDDDDDDYDDDDDDYGDDGGDGEDDKDDTDGDDDEEGEGEESEKGPDSIDSLFSPVPKAKRRPSPEGVLIVRARRDAPP